MKRPTRPALRTFKPDIAKLAPVLAELCALGDGKDPVECIGWADDAGKPRRLRADYENGWRIEIRLRANGSISSWRASLKLRAKYEPKS